MYILEFNLSTKLKHITVSERNYHNLKRLGSAGDSFNDVVTQLLKQVLQAGDSPQSPQPVVVESRKPNGSDSNG